jgi:sulfite reductase (ferredoxin)
MCWCQAGANWYTFYDAANERNYRNALKFQRKYEESVKCAEAIAWLIGQGLTQLVGGRKCETLAEQAEELSHVLPAKPALAKSLSNFAQYFSRPVEDLNDQVLTNWYAEMDSWTNDVAEFCMEFDRQLDLAGALPQSESKPVLARHASQPVSVA